MVQNHAGWYYRQFFDVFYEQFGEPRYFVRLGSTDGGKTNYAKEWSNKGVVGIGWAGIGDLSDYLTGREELIDFFLAKQSECFAVEVDIHKRIDLIEGKDAQDTADMRLVLRYRYIDGLQWWQAAKKLHVSIRKAQYLETEASLLFPLPEDWEEKCARRCANENVNV
jgi:hypothetical protein